MVALDSTEGPLTCRKPLTVAFVATPSAPLTLSANAVSYRGDLMAAMAASLLASWQRLVRADPNAPALIDATAERIWSRRELDAAGAAWAAAAPPDLAGRTVAFAAPNGAGWWQLWLGLLQADAVAAPLDAGEPPAGQRHLAESAGAAWL